MRTLNECVTRGKILDKILKYQYFAHEWCVIRGILPIELIEKAAEEDRSDFVRDILIRYKNLLRRRKSKNVVEKNEHCVL